MVRLRCTGLAALLLLAGCASLFERSGEQFSQGMTGALVDDARAGRLDPLVDHTIATLAIAAERELTPRVERDVRLLVRAALEALDPAAREEELDAFARRLTASVVQTMGADLSRATEQRIGPALGAVLRDDVLPALSTALRDDFGPATEELISRATKSAGEELAASLLPGGSLDRALAHQRGLALGEVEAAVQRQLSSSEGIADRLTDRLLGAAAAAALFMTLVGALALWLWWRSRKQAHGYERAVEVVTTLIHEGAGRSGTVEELVAALRSQDRSKEGAAALDAFLESRPHLKVRKPPG